MSRGLGCNQRLFLMAMRQIEKDQGDQEGYGRLTHMALCLADAWAAVVAKERGSLLDQYLDGRFNPGRIKRLLYDRGLARGERLTDAGRVKADELMAMENVQHHYPNILQAKLVYGDGWKNLPGLEHLKASRPEYPHMLDWFGRYEQRKRR
jgi:hypothetical protein